MRPDHRTRDAADSRAATKLAPVCCCRRTADNGADEMPHAIQRKADVATPDLPAEGYPVSEEAVESWFRERHGRPPTERELGVIIGEMAHREATPPHRGPDADPQGWMMGPPAPATRR
jgi:hypothetical protein